MKTILVSAYAVNPYKGSEDGTGWNLLREIASHHRVALVTRENNRPEIERFLAESPAEWQERVDFHYFDLPKWARFWKKGARGALPYYLLWQLALPRFVRKAGIQFDISHQVNFHNDWLPTFLYRLGKPVVWGPVGHHPPVPRAFLEKVYGRRAWWQDRKRHWIKTAARKLNPWYRRSIAKLDHILTINPRVSAVTGFPAQKSSTLPAVGAHPREVVQKNQHSFSILSVGRFVPLKGFDIAIQGFAHFMSHLPAGLGANARLCLVGKGPEKERLMELAEASGWGPQIDFVEWMPQKELMELYGQSDVFLFPSHEGAGMVVPEALSFGLPVVCFDNAGPGELVTEECGVRIPYGGYDEAVNGFANALEGLYGNAHLRQRMAKAARRHLENVLSWRSKGLALKKIYDSILPA